ncbi:MAG: prephenate dehydratase [Methanobrevibacter sp.]|jgi:prephenate dehydratase|nr:prephenate dehydratase [Candidatus Methanovirga aequatorialis]
MESTLYFGGLLIKSIAFLGPKGTFTHEVASFLGENLFSYCSIPSVLKAVENGECDLGVVPIENSIEGPVGITLDLLVHSKLYIQGEIVLPISHNLITKRDCEIHDIKYVYSHPQALAQCQSYLENRGLKPLFTLSTAAAVKLVVERNDSAAIGTLKAAQLYDLNILDKNIQDTDNNKTRFIILSKDFGLKSENNKTSILFETYQDSPGELYHILGFFANNNINLTKIESRPSKEGLGKYIFFLDFEGHKNDKVVKDILDKTRTKTSIMKVLGSYPSL